TAAAQVLLIVTGSPAWKPQATLALVTMSSRARSSPSRQIPKPSPRSALRSITMGPSLPLLPPGGGDSRRTLPDRRPDNQDLCPQTGRQRGETNRVWEAEPISPSTSYRVDRARPRPDGPTTVSASRQIHSPTGARNSEITRSTLTNR